MRYQHLNLIDWPFRIVPDESFYSLLADREQLTNDIKKLLRNLLRRTSSSMHLMWAWFGAGKTHTLRHIEYLCKTGTNIIPVYNEFPKSTRNFLDIYRSFISGIDLEEVKTAYLEIFTSSVKEDIQKELTFDFPDLSNALILLYQGTSDQQEIVNRWLRTECRSKRILRNIGVMNPIQSVEDAIKVITWIIRLIYLRGESSQEVKRVLWIIDEYQKIEKLRTPAIEQINGCLHSIFNKCPNGLSIIISFSGYPKEKKLPIWLSKEIKDRIGIEKPLLLPPLNDNEAIIFIKDILSFFRINKQNNNEYFPFTKNSVKEIISIIKNRAKKSRRQGEEPKPRTIMHFFNEVLQEADFLIEQGEIEIISSNFAHNILKDVFLPEV